MRCLIGVRAADADGGMCFLMNDFSGDPNDLIGDMQRYATLPPEHKPEMIPYENTIMLGAMSALADVEYAFELGLEDGKPTLAVIEVCYVEMPPGMPPIMMQMKHRAENDFSE